MGNVQLDFSEDYLNVNIDGKMSRNHSLLYLGISHCMYMPQLDMPQLNLHLLMDIYIVASFGVLQIELLGTLK